MLLSPCRNWSGKTLTVFKRTNTQRTWYFSKKNPSSNPPSSLVGLGCPAEATDMGFQRQSGCDRTPLEFRGTPALPVLIIGPFTEITFFLPEWLWSYSSGYNFQSTGCISIRVVTFWRLQNQTLQIWWRDAGMNSFHNSPLQAWLPVHMLSYDTSCTRAHVGAVGEKWEK